MLESGQADWGAWISAIHVPLAVLCLSLVFVAGVLACLLGWSEWSLKHHHPYRNRFKIPSLQKLEVWLVRSVWLGFICLTVLLAMSAVYFPLRYWQWKIKATMGGLAWFLLGGLLLGRYLKGWRGMKAVGWTLTGGILILAVFLVGYL